MNHILHTTMAVSRFAGFWLVFEADLYKTLQVILKEFTSRN